MTRQGDAVVVVPPAQPTTVTRNLLRLLAAALAILAVLFAVLTYSYLRVAGQLDRTRAGQTAQNEVVSDLASRIAEDSAVLREVRELAALFAVLVSKDEADREEARRSLAELTAQNRRDDREAQSTTTSTTTTTRPRSTTTTSTSTTRPSCQREIAGICLIP